MSRPSFMPTSPWRAWSRRLVTALALAGGAVISQPACLGELPEPLRCPPAATYAACPLQPLAVRSPDEGPPRPGLDAGGPVPEPAPAPAPTAPSCALDRILCIQQQRRTCACAPAAECARDDTACSPAPDCPRSVREAARGATCLETTATLLPGRLRPEPCICGCASCATTCDGQGPILGQGQSMRLSLPEDLPASGELRVMARVRGGGQVAIEARPVEGDAQALADVDSSVEFSEALSGAGSAYTWSTRARRPAAVVLTITSEVAVEVDCVVPFVSP